MKRNATVKQIFYYIHNIRVTLSDKLRVWVYQDEMQGDPCCNEKIWPPWLHVDNSGQLLDSVEQQVALLNGFLVLPVFAIRSIGFHNLIHFINFAVETASSYESGQFLVDELCADTKGLSHVAQGERAVGL